MLRPFKHRGFNIFQTFWGVSEALTCCRKVVIAKQKNCRVPSSAFLQDDSPLTNPQQLILLILWRNPSGNDPDDDDDDDEEDSCGDHHHHQGEDAAPLLRLPLLRSKDEGKQRRLSQQRRFI